MAGEKSEKATPKRRSDERKKGNVFQSKDAVSVAVLLVSFYGAQFILPTMVSHIHRLFNLSFNSWMQIKVLNQTELSTIFLQSAWIFVLILFPILGLMLLVNIAASGAQTGFIFNTSSLAFKLERLDPIKGLQKLISLRSFFEMFKAIFKILLLVAVIYMVLKPELPILFTMFQSDLISSLTYGLKLIMKLALNVGMIFIFLALVDYFYQRYEYEKNIKMSKQDIKEEYKQMEGDPAIKSKIKERQRMFAQRRMMQNVPKADVIIRNPTHYAIAIQYKLGEQRAPKVIAKGMDSIALKIIEIAEKNTIPCIENRSLARSLYEQVEMEAEIPEKFYQAIAEILAVLYQNQRKGG